jgi:precorrin-3B synthase
MPTGDGLLVRFMPIAPIGLDAFAAFCAAARAHGNGIVEITARGSVQVRGLTPDSAAPFAATVAGLGIAAFDGVQVIASALDRDPDALIDAAALAAELRRAIADARLQLAPKISVVVDGGGSLHLDAVSADVRLRAIGPAHRPRLIVALGGDDAMATTLGAVAPGDAVAAVLALLRVIATHGPAARAADIMRREGAFAAVTDGLIEAARAAPPRPPAAAIGQHRLRDDSLALGVGLAFGHAHADALADLGRHAGGLGARDVRSAPGRVLLLIGAADASAAALTASAAKLGFIVDPADPRRRIVACPGAPACASGMIAARTIAAELAPRLVGGHGGVAVHISGCLKGCAHPPPAALTVVGTEHGCGIIRDGAARAAPSRFVDPSGLAAEIARLVKPTVEAVHG